MEEEHVAVGIPQEILSVLAHELSSPVSVIKGFAEALLVDQGKLSDDERHRYVEAIARGADQVTALVTTLTDVHGVETGTIDVHPSPLDLGAFVAMTVKDMQQVIPGHTVNVETIDVVAPADLVRVRQVLINLLTNARKFSPPRTTIDVAMAAHNGQATISVHNEGDPIPVTMRDALFQKFSRLGTSKVGMGLGLYISRGIMRAHGGDLTYEAPPEGGSSFVMRLPTA